MIHPRVILLGDVGIAAQFVGVAKKMARMSYKAGLRSHEWRGAQVSIRVANVLPTLHYVDPLWDEPEMGKKLFHPECPPEEKELAEEEDRECERPPPMWIDVELPPPMIKDGYTVYLNGQSTVWITGESGADFFAPTWIPEGLVLTPRSGDAPYGYGFPKREPCTIVEVDDVETLVGGGKINAPFGTKIESEADEALNQVIINQWERNRYLDTKEGVTGYPTFEELLGADKLFSAIVGFPVENRRLRDTHETAVNLGRPIGQQAYIVYWPMFYTPVTCDGDGSYWYTIYTDEKNPKHGIDEPGLNHWEWREKLPFSHAPFIDEPAWRAAKALGQEKHLVKYRQFVTHDGNSYDWDPLIDEPETDSWYCHWPEELLYDNDAYEMLFTLTNQYRAQVGLNPVTREIRGFANTARMAITENQLAKTLNHDSPKFRQGYQTFVQRLQNAGGNALLAGENLIGGGPLGLSATSGRAAAELWRGSPGHYANMIDAEWSKPPGATAMEALGAVLGALDEVIGSPRDEITGGFWGQVFTQRKEWLYAGPIFHPGEAGNFSSYNFDSPIGHVEREAQLFLGFRGRGLFNRPVAGGGISSVVGGGISLGGVIFYENNERWIRQVVFYPIGMWVCYKAPLDNRSCDWISESTHVDASVAPIRWPYGTATFSLDGSKGVCSYMVLGDSVASYLLPMAEGQVPARQTNQRVLEITNGIIAVRETIQPPEIVYSHTLVEIPVDTKPVPSTIEYITQYTQELNDTYDFYPFVDAGGTVRYLTRTIELYVDQTQTGYKDTPFSPSPVWTAEYSLFDKVNFLDGEMVVAQQAVEKQTVTEHEKKPLILVGEAFFVVFLHINPVTNDRVYAKITLRGEVAAVYGTMKIYVHDGAQTIDELIMSFDEVLIDDDASALTVPKITGQWVKENRVPSSFVTNVYNPVMFMQRDVTGVWYPTMDFRSGGDRYWICTSDPTHRAYVGKIITGTFRLDMWPGFGWGSRCYASGDGMNFNFSGSLKIASLSGAHDGIGCQLARYKERLVVQLQFNTEAPELMWKFPVPADEFFVWANFDLEGEVGIGPLSKGIAPFGTA